MAGQNFNLSVPNASATWTMGQGAVLGVTCTTTDNVFVFAGVQTVLESASHMRFATTALLSGAGTGGVLLGTPATIQASAGGGVQIYAGAGITPAIGGPGGPGAPFGASKPADFKAGEVAAANNKFNDFMKGAGDVAGGVAGMTQGGWDAAKGAWDVAKGTWDMAKAVGVEENKTVEGIAKGGDIVAGMGDMVSALGKDDTAGFIVATVGVAGKLVGATGAYDNSGNLKAIGDATAAKAAAATAATQAGGPGAPSDGCRIVEIAPANIDRKTGADMTALVAGKKTTDVDGKIEYQSGASISMKAFSKVETSSMSFEAFASISAKMVGLAKASVESLGFVAIDGKAKVKIESMAKIVAEAPKVEITGKAKLKLDSGASIEMGAPDIEVKGTDIEINGSGKIDLVAGTLNLKAPTTVHDKMTCNKMVNIQSVLYVKKDATVSGKLRASGNVILG